MSQSTNRAALRAGTWYIIGNFALKSIALITTPIFTRLLTPNDFGITQTYTSWMGIITIIGTLDIYSCIQIARHDYKDSEVDRFVSSVLTLSTLSLSFVYLLINVFRGVMEPILGIPWILVDLLFVEVLFTNAFTLMQTKLKSFLRYKAFLFFSLLIAVASPLLAIVLISGQTSDLYFWRILGFALPKIGISAFIFIYILSKGKTFYNKSYWKYALWISVPLIPHHLAGNILNHFDKIQINSIIGSAEAGIYSLGYNIALILSTAWQSFNGAWVPWFFGKMKNDEVDDIRRFVKPYLVAFTLIFFFFLSIGPEAIRILGPEAYWGGAQVVPPVLLGIYAQFLYSLYVNIEFYYKKTGYIAFGTIFAAVLNIVLNAIFIPIFGYVAAAYTTLVGYLSLMAIHVYVSSQWEKRDLFDLRFILSWSLFVFVASFAIAMLYDAPIWRFTLVTVIFVIGVVTYRQKMLNLLKSLRRKKG